MPGSFKRLLECFFVWGQPNARGHMAEARAIFTHAAPDLKNGGTSETNQLLAYVVFDVHTWLHVPIYTQGEVATALKKMDVEVKYTVPRQDESEHYIDSFEVVQRQKRAHGMMSDKPVAVVSFVPHIHRAVWVYEKQGFSVIIPDELPKLVWGERLGMWWWRSRFTVYPYELLARLFYWWKGYI